WIAEPRLGTDHEEDDERGGAPELVAARRVELARPEDAPVTIALHDTRVQVAKGGLQLVTLNHNLPFPHGHERVSTQPGGDGAFQLVLRDARRLTRGRRPNELELLRRRRLADSHREEQDACFCRPSVRHRASVVRAIPKKVYAATGDILQTVGFG